MPQYRKSDQKFRFRSYRGKEPSAEELRQELEDVVNDYETQLQDLVDQLNERDETLVATTEALAELTARVEALEAGP